MNGTSLVELLLDCAANPVDADRPQRTPDAAAITDSGDHADASFPAVNSIIAAARTLLPQLQIDLTTSNSLPTPAIAGGESDTTFDV